MPRLLPLVVLLFASASASAHGLGVQAACGTESVRVEVYFDTDDPADGVTVSLLGPAGELLATAATDDKGVCVFARPVPGNYTLRADAGAGHRATAKLTVPESRVEGGGSGGANREGRVGWRRWGGIALGLLIIALGTLALRRARRPGPGGTPPTGPPKPRPAGGSAASGPTR